MSIKKKAVVALTTGAITISTFHHIPGEIELDKEHTHEGILSYIHNVELHKNAIVSGTSLLSEEKLPPPIKVLGSNPENPGEKIFLIGIPDTTE